MTCQDFPRKRGYARLFFVAALLAWLVPFFVAGWTGRSWSVFPRAWSFQHSAAGLFTRSSTRWWDHHLEGQDAQDRRFEIPERGPFPMGAFGFRTRLDRILNDSNRSRLAGQIRLRLAEHVLAWHRRTAGESAKETAGGESAAAWKAIRFVRSSWQVGEPAMKHPAGEWTTPAVTEIPAANRQVIGTYQILKDRVIEVGQRPSGNRVVQAPASPRKSNARALPANPQPARGGVPVVVPKRPSAPPVAAQQTPVEGDKEPRPGAAAPARPPVVRVLPAPEQPSRRLPSGAPAGAPGVRPPVSRPLAPVPRLQPPVKAGSTPPVRPSILRQPPSLLPPSAKQPPATRVDPSKPATVPPSAEAPSTATPPAASPAAATK